jgi:cytidylate kinase
MEAAKKQIITIAGGPGSGKSSTAKTVTAALGFQHFSSGDLFRALGKEMGFDVLNANLTAEQDSEIDHAVDGRLREIGATEDELVVDSRMAWYWMPQSYKVFLELDLLGAAKRILDGMDDARLASEHVHRDPQEYATILQKRLDSEKRRYRKLYDVDPFDTSHYDLVVDSARYNLEQVVEQILAGFHEWLKR